MPTFWLSPPVVQLARAFDFHMAQHELGLPTLQVRTWYIDHLRFPENPLYRDVTLSPPWTAWLPQLVATWADLVDFNINVEFAVVRPVPLEVEADGVRAHIIVWQHHHAQRKVGLLRVAQSDGQRMYALAVPQYVTREGLLRVAGKTATCRHRRCVVRHGPLEIVYSMIMFS